MTFIYFLVNVTLFVITGVFFILSHYICIELALFISVVIYIIANYFEFRLMKRKYFNF